MQVRGLEAPKTQGLWLSRFVLALAWRYGVASTEDLQHIERWIGSLAKKGVTCMI